MNRAELLARAQSFAEQGMVDQCVIRRRTGDTLDEFSGTITPDYATPDPYAGRCRVRQARAQAALEDVGEDAVLVLRLELQLPVAVTGLQVGDEVTITASRDPDLPGRAFLVRDLMHQTDSSARRVQLTERTG